MKNPDISKMQNKLRHSRDFVDKILVAIPGYKSYVEAAEAYDSDRVVREYLSDRIIHLKSGITSFSAELVRKGEHDIVKKIEDITIFMERILKKCQFTDYSSSMLSKMNIAEEGKASLVEYDNMLLYLLEETFILVSSLDQTETSAKGQVLNSIKNKLESFEKFYDDRKYKIMEAI